MDILDIIEQFDQRLSRQEKNLIRRSYDINGFQPPEFRERILEIINQNDLGLMPCEENEIINFYSEPDIQNFGKGTIQKRLAELRNGNGNGNGHK